MLERSPRDLLVVVLTLLLSGIAAVGHFSLRQELDNASMKSTASPAARAAARRAREFGREATVLVLLEPAGPALSAAPEGVTVTRWRAALDALPDVLSTRVLPTSDAAGTVVAVEVRGGGPAVERTCAGIRGATPPGYRVSLTGQLAGEIAIARALAREQRRVVPAILAVLAALLLAIYRRPALVLAALLPGLCSILLLGGLQYVLGMSVNPVSALLAPVVLIVGVAGSVHLIERYRDLCRRGLPPAAAPRRAVRSLARPIVLTAATTVAGFLALTLRSIPALRAFGLLAALGVLLASLVTVGVVPSWLRLFGPRAAPPPRRIARSGSYVRGLRAASPWLVGAVVVASAFLVRRGLEVTTDTEPLHILPPHHPFRLATDRVAQRIGGIETFELLLPAPLPAGASLRAAALGAALGEEPAVQSLLGAPRRSAAGSLLVAALLRPGGSAERAALFDRVEERAVAAGFAGARVTGTAVLVARDSEALVREQRRGLLTMLLVLLGLLAVGLRSLPLGVVGLLPNVVPCAALYGALALAGRPLSVATTMIATVMLGLIVDDTIHFLHEYRAVRRRDLDRTRAVIRALAACGRPIVITSVVLSLGFTAGLAGRLTTTTEFAGLSALTILAALVCDLVLLPAVLLLPEWRALARRSSPSPSVTSCPKTTT